MLDSIFLDLLKNLIENEEIANGLDVLSSGNNFYYDFTETFNKSGIFTIDEFLRTQVPYRKIGKFAITYRLLKNEISENHFKDEWFQFLWNRIKRNLNQVQEIQKTSIGFITFNYDLSLEHILFAAVKNAFHGASDLDIKMAFNAIPIVHVHGRIKKLPWEDGYKDDLDKFGLNELDLNKIFEMSKGIKLVHENDDNNVLIEARQLISEAENIVFLGFGFHRDNINKLNELKTEWVQQKVIAKPPYSLRTALQYPNPAYSKLRSNKVSAPVNNAGVQVSIFTHKKKLATAIKLDESAKSEAKYINGLQGINFLNHKSIDEFLRENITAFL